MAIQLKTADERADFILDQGPFQEKDLKLYPRHVIQDYLMTAEAHLKRVGPEKFLENKEALADYAENWIFKEKWEIFPGV